MKFLHILYILLIGLLFSPVASVQAQTEADTPVVRAILFYSPSCGHCEYVIQQTLLPLVDQYGEQLQIVAIDVTQPEGQTHFLTATDAFQLS
jgi:thiol-disulfide isomerase/thioredoxin